MKNFRIVITALFAIVLAGGCAKEALPVTVEFAQDRYELTVGEVLDLAAEVKVQNSSEKPKFVSLSAKVASVGADGKVQALSAGEARITASIGDVTARCSVIVSDITASEISLTAPEGVVAEEETWGTVTAAVSPSNFDMKNLTWKFEASDEDLDFHYEKVSESEYKFRFGAYVEGGKVTIKVSDKNSSVVGTAVVNAIEPEPEEVAATRISLDYPSSLTEGEDAWGTIKATVTPEDYNNENLVWTFTPNMNEAGFAYEKVAANEYKVRFATYVEGGKVDINVKDVVSGLYNSATIYVEERPAQGVTSLAVSPETITMHTDSDPVSLQITLEPVDYDKALLVWSSSDETVVTVSEGVITVVGEGEAVVKVKDSLSENEAQCAVTVLPAVTEAQVKSIVLSETNLSMRLTSDAVQLTAECYDGANGNGNKIENYSNLEWSAAKAQAVIGYVDIVEVSQTGVVTPKNIGFTTITVVDKANPSISATCNVNVTGVTPNGITLTTTALTLPVGMEYTGLEAKITPENCDYLGVTWNSSDESVATVDTEGKITTLAAGSTIISVTTNAGGYTAECNLTVKDTDFTVSLSVPAEAVNGIAQGLSTKITASYMSMDGTPYTPSEVSWTSSDPSLVTVDNEGNVTVLDTITIDGDKEVTITHTADGETSSVVIKVIMALPESLAITAYPENKQMMTGDTFTFQAAITPSTADQSVKWTCYSPTVEDAWTYIDIDSGYFIAKKPGQYEVTAMAGYEYRDSYNNLHTFTDVRASVVFEVLPVAIQSAVLNETSLSLVAGNSAALNVTITPSDATYKTIAWSSSDETVATVSESGIVTAVAPGDAVITAYQAENDLTLTCSVAVSAADLQFNLGDYYYSDGTISSELIAGKTVLGVVCLINDVTGHDNTLKADFPSCKNGLVLALKDAASVKWAAYGHCVSDKWAVANGFMSLAGASSYSWGEHYLTAEGKVYCGYNNTKALEAYKASDFYAGLDMAYYEIGLLNNWDRWNGIDSTSLSVSGWYIPSVAEWLAIGDNATVVENALVAASGDAMGASYWSSTENPNSGSWAVCVDVKNKTFVTNKAKSSELPVRYVFAF